MEKSPLTFSSAKFSWERTYALECGPTGPSSSGADTAVLCGPLSYLIPWRCEAGVTAPCHGCVDAGHSGGQQLAGCAHLAKAEPGVTLRLLTSGPELCPTPLPSMRG